MNSAAIALGSNLGDREAHLAFAVSRLRDVLSDVCVSAWHETEAVTANPQPAYLNGALTGKTTMSPWALLQTLQAIERERGRERPYPEAPRTLDLDLILYGSEVLAEDGLRVPHPRFRERAFVLEPLAEIAPDWIEPQTGLTIAELLQRLRG